MFRLFRPIPFSLVLLVWVLLAGAILPELGLLGPRAAAGQQPGWRLVFSDEFNTDTFDTARWKTAFPWGRDRRHLGELQRYTPEGVTLGDGNLRIVARPTDRGGYGYTSGLISSHASFAQEYGRFEMRARLPLGQGLWPAFWLLPETERWPPEIDVFEALGHQTDTVYMNVHWREEGKHLQRKGTFSGPDFSANYHTFAVEWNPREIVWFVDGIERHRVEDANPRGPMYLLANLAVGGEWPGAPDASTPFPAVFAIDYIRVYEWVTEEDGDTARRQDGKMASREQRIFSR